MLVLWGIASSIVVAWLVFAHFALRTELSNAVERRLQGRRVLVSSRFGPAVVGIFRSRIIVPAWILSLEDTEQRLIVSHECEHQSARDPLLGFIGLAAVIVFPWNAPLWWQLGRLRVAIELDCDRRVIGRHRCDPFEYGSILLAVRARTTHQVHSALALVGRRSVLGQRIEAITSSRGTSVKRTALAAGGVLVSAGLMAFVPQPALPASMQRVVRVLSAPPAETTRARQTIDPAVDSIRAAATPALLPTTSASASSAVDARTKTTSKAARARRSNRPVKPTTTGSANATPSPIDTLVNAKSPTSTDIVQREAADTVMPAVSTLRTIDSITDTTVVRARSNGARFGPADSLRAIATDSTRRSAMMRAAPGGPPDSLRRGGGFGGMIRANGMLTPRPPLKDSTQRDSSRTGGAVGGGRGTPPPRDSSAVITRRPGGAQIRKAAADSNSRGA
jgi:hypothetical protein